MNTDDPMVIEKIWPIAPLISDKQTTIVVAGAWKGLYMHYLAQRFPDAKVIGFEPQGGAWFDARERIRDLPNAKIHPWALGLCDENLALGQSSTDGASLLSSCPPLAHVQVKDAARILADLGLISLFVMNMEGYEYLLLPYLMGNKIIKRIESLAIQFHPDWFKADLRNPLRAHYGEPVYEDDLVWTYWKCRP